MKNTLLLGIIFGIAIGCNSTNQNQLKEVLTIRIPGEFEPHESIWLGFKTIESNVANDSTTLEIIKALNPYVNLTLIVEHERLFIEGMKYLAHIGLDTNKINIEHQSPTDIWFRDPGPIFGITGDNKLAIADFKYTNYSNVLPDSIDEKAIAHESIDRNIAEQLNIPTVVSNVAIEGGAFEVNGKGTLIQVENVTLKRNPHLSKKEIEDDFSKNFGINNVIWLPAGVVDDPHNFDRIQGNTFGYGTGGHTDEFVRFANDSTILISWISETEKELHPINKLNYEILSKNYKILKNSTRQNGRPFTIIKIPHPSPQTYDLIIYPSWFYSDYWKRIVDNHNLSLNDTIQMAYTRSYLNYIISNGVVLLPEYKKKNQPSMASEKDQKVRHLFEEIFPNRKIIGINPIYFNQDGGGMHCRCQTEPKIKTQSISGS